MSAVLFSHAGMLPRERRVISDVITKKIAYVVMIFSI